MGQPTSIHWDDFIPMARVLGMISSTIGMIHPNHPNCITGLDVDAATTNADVTADVDVDIDEKTNCVLVNSDFPN